MLSVTEISGVSPGFTPAWTQPACRHTIMVSVLLIFIMTLKNNLTIDLYPDSVYDLNKVAEKKLWRKAVTILIVAYS